MASLDAESVSTPCFAHNAGSEHHPQLCEELQESLLAGWGGIGFRSPGSSSTLSWNRPLRVVHRRRLASPGPETGGPLQHPDVQTVETGLVSTGLDRPVGTPSTAEDQAADRAAISSCRGKRRAGVAREGRRNGQDRAGAQRVIARVRSGVTTGCGGRRFAPPLDRGDIT